MSKPPTNDVWDAPEHTKAKIDIVSSYCHIWAKVFGNSDHFRGMPLTYIDGFAGPGEYDGQVDGSPIAALKAFENALSEVGSKWKAGPIRCIFYEAKKGRVQNLQSLLSERAMAGNLEVSCVRKCTFQKGIEIDHGLPAFNSRAPLLVFIDPFGVKGVPFATVERILRSPTSEIVLNFGNGLDRIFRAGQWSKSELLLDSLFGCGDWRQRLDKYADARTNSLAALQLYKERLQSIGMEYTFAFEMGHSMTRLDYFLLFATRKEAGIKIMKQRMRRYSQTGDYSFYDTYQGPQAIQFNLFPTVQKDLSETMHDRFKGRTISYREMLRYVFNDTGETSYKQKFLKPLKDKGVIEIIGTYPDDIKYIHFLEVQDAKAVKH